MKYIYIFICISLLHMQRYLYMTDIQTNISEGSRSSSIHPLIHLFTPMCEGYCTLMELTSEHPKKLWTTDPQLQRPAIVAALAHCSVKTWTISSNGTSFRLHRLCCSTRSNFKPWPSHWQGMIWGGANPQNFCMPCRMSSPHLNCDDLRSSGFICVKCSLPRSRLPCPGFFGGTPWWLHGLLCRCRLLQSCVVSR